MAYFADLTPYTYIKRHQMPNLLNVGWLDRAHAYSRGDVPVGLLERLTHYCEVAVAQTRGFHECEFCQHSEIPNITGGLKLGSSEIRVFGRNRTVFASPNLILHYVAAHRYLPPREFIDAIMTSAGPASESYAKLLASAGILAGSCLRVK